jgi:large subunit ribosomal protein L9
MEHEKAVIAARQAKLKSAASEQAKKLGAIKVTIKRKVGEQDKLYGSVTALDIAEAVAAQGQKIDRRHIHLPDPIKTVGEHEVEVRLHRDVVSKISVSVQAE